MNARANSIALESLPTSLRSGIEMKVVLQISRISRSENEHSKLLQETDFNHERDV